MSTEVKVAHSKVMSPQNQSARMSEVPTTPGGVLASSKTENNGTFEYERNKEGELVCADESLF